jgi:hypothetical protein
MFGGDQQLKKLEAELKKKTVQLDQLEGTCNKLNTDIEAGKRQALEFKRVWTL